MCRLFHKCPFSLSVDWRVLWRESSACSMTSLCFCKRLAVRGEVCGTGSLREASPSRLTTDSALAMPFATDLCFNKIRFICLFIYLFVFFHFQLPEQKEELTALQAGPEQQASQKVNRLTITQFACSWPWTSLDPSNQRQCIVKASYSRQSIPILGVCWA